MDPGCSVAGAFSARKRRRFVELPVLFRDDALDSRLSRRTGSPEALYAPQLASYARALSAVLVPATIVKGTILAFVRG